MNRELFYVGLTHQSAPLAIRENLRSDRESQIALLSRLSSLGGGRMVLATCERFEVYATAEHAAADTWLAFLADWCHWSLDFARSYARMLSGSRAAEHLIRVAAGLESRILGERQILGQVRNAFQFALEQESLDAQMSTLTRTAIRAGKRARQETQLATGSRSIVTAALDWLTDRHGGLAGRAVAVVGSGRLAALAVEKIAERRPRRVIIVGRNEPRVAELALRYDAQSVGMPALGRTIADTDVVMTCTASPTYLIDTTLISAARTTPLLLIDLSVPRNVDPGVARLPGVALGHLDELVAHGVSTGPSASVVPESDVIRQAEGIVHEELCSFLRWSRDRQVAPMIAELFRCSDGGAMDKRALHAQIVRLKTGVAA